MPDQTGPIASRGDIPTLVESLGLYVVAMAWILVQEIPGYVTKVGRLIAWALLALVMVALLVASVVLSAAMACVISYPITSLLH